MVNVEFRMIRLLLLIPVLLLFGFSPLKTRPIHYRSDAGTALMILPNCKNDGFYFTLNKDSEECTEEISGSVMPSKQEFRFEKDGILLLFRKRGRTMIVTETGVTEDRCTIFSGTYKQL